MTKTIPYMLCLVALALSGCGERAEVHAPGDCAAPAYRVPVDTLQNAVVRAYINRFGYVDVDDREKHRVEVAGARYSVATEVSEDGRGMAAARIAVSDQTSFDAIRKLDKLASRIAFEMSRADVKP